MSTTRYRHLKAGLLALLWLAAYALTVDSVFPRGDDLAHLVADRAVPIPQRGLWVANRVIDGFFTAFTFQAFESLYSVVPGIRAGRDFVDLFRAFNALIYATALGCAAALLCRSLRVWIRKGLLQFLFAWLAGLGALFQWMPPNVGMTELFAYQVTAVITIAFLSIAYPMIDPGGDAMGQPAAERFSGSTYLLLSLLAYLTAVGLEAFVAFAWLYIAAHYATSSGFFLRRSRASPGPRSMFPSTFRDSLNRHTIALQFLVYSIWSIHALTTSGRTRVGLAAGPQSVSWSDVLELTLMAIRSPGAQLVALVLVFCAGFGLLRSVHLAGVDRGLMIGRNALVSQFAFSLVVGAGYLAGLVALGAVTRIDYVNDAKLVFPLKFVLLVQLLALSLSLLSALTSGAMKRIAVVVVFAWCAAVVASQMSVATGQREAARQVRDAFQRAALAQGNVVGVPFPLPQAIPANEGYPLLPAANAADWYRRSYRLMLNKFYGTHFDSSGPVFSAQDDAVVPRPAR